QVAVEIQVTAEQNAVGLAGLKCAYACDLPSPQKLSGQIPDQAVNKTVTNIKISISTLGSTVETVLRQSPRPSQIEYIRDFIDGVRPGVSRRELESTRKSLVSLDLQGVIDRIGIRLNRSE